MNGVAALDRTSPHKRRTARRPRRRAPARPARTGVARPHVRFTWYAGVAVMAAFRVVEWPLAILMMIGHEVAHHAHHEALRDFAEGLEAGA